MKLTPDYNVSYKGVFHPAGKPFEIDEKDADEMRRHGNIQKDAAEPNRRTARR